MVVLSEPFISNELQKYCYPDIFAVHDVTVSQFYPACRGTVRAPTRGGASDRAWAGDGQALGGLHCPEPRPKCNAAGWGQWAAEPAGRPWGTARKCHLQVRQTSYFKKFAKLMGSLCLNVALLLTIWLLFFCRAKDLGLLKRRERRMRESLMLPWQQLNDWMYW